VLNRNALKQLAISFPASPGARAADAKNPMRIYPAFYSILSKV
jgi:hypothetical protein